MLFARLLKTRDWANFNLEIFVEAQGKSKIREKIPIDFAGSASTWLKLTLSFWKQD